MTEDEVVESILAKSRVDYPVEFMAVVVEFVNSVVEEVSKWPEKGLQRAFLDTAESCVWALKDFGLGPKETLGIVKEAFVPSKFLASSKSLF